MTQANKTDLHDGIHGMVPREKMDEGPRSRRDVYDVVPGAPLRQEEFGYYCLERWAEQGMPADADKNELFGFDPPGDVRLRGLGWCEAAFVPAFEEAVIEDRGDYEVVRDRAGRHVLCFKGRRSGFMPEYLDHPVKDRRTWEELAKWRLDFDAPERVPAEEKMQQLRESAGKGYMVTQQVVGGYMYLRSLMGPGDVLYKFCDEPELIHDCMETWFKLADKVIAMHQQYLTIDELFFGEDICYNNGPLISPDMMREFLLPYYKQLIDNLKSRQLDPARRLHVHIDTDGDCRPVIPVYREIGMDVMSPFEVASGCDVVEIGRQYPWLVMRGGVDKRELAKGKDAIDRLVDRIFPVMKARGGYIPTCDHGVPEEVKYEDYLHYRKRALEFA